MSETPKRKRTKKRRAAEAEGAEEQASEAPPPAPAPEIEPESGNGSGNGNGSAAATLKEWAQGAALPRDIALVFGLVLPAMLLAANLWRVRGFTVDDSFISYRYARNLARGLGLVYNPGERIEGYTNFLFTVLLAGGIKLGIDPEALSKGIGAGSAFASLGLTYGIAARLRPYRTIPCIATWLLASTIVFTGWSVFGLETGFFVALILGGTYLFLRETDLGPTLDEASPDTPPRRAFPWSGVVFALAGLTRPEAPMFLGLLMLFLGWGLVGRQNLLRGALFAGPVLVHLLFRHAYYGSWVPNTLGAKTGNFEGQLRSGLTYVQSYMTHAGPVVYLALLGVAYGVTRSRRDVMAVTAIAVAVMGYVTLVGGDWMKFFRFMAPFEPFCFLLVDLGVRRAADRRDPVTNLALAFFAAFMVPLRGTALREAQADFLQNEKRFWDRAAGGTARWFQQAPPGEIALGDIGYVGWATDYPILDLLGLTDPVISKLPGGYTQKLGPGFADRLFDKKSRYVLIISSSLDCQHPSVPGSQVLFNDPRFRRDYQIAGKVPLDNGFAWCFFERKQQP